VDDSRPARNPPAVKATAGDALGPVVPDHPLPLAWLLPWLLALTGILITLALIA